MFAGIRESDEPKEQQGQYPQVGAAPFYEGTSIYAGGFLNGDLPGSDQQSDGHNSR